MTHAILDKIRELRESGASPIDVDTALMALEECVTALEQIKQHKGNTNIGTCCVFQHCQPVYEDNEKIANCSFQYGVNRGFNECAFPAEDALTKVRTLMGGGGE